jgi:hypothetical protein
MISVYRILVGKSERDHHLGDQGLNWRIVSRRIEKKIECEGVELIHVAHDRSQWQAVANMALNLGVS